MLQSVAQGPKLQDISIQELDQLLLILTELVGILPANRPGKESALLLIQSLVRNFGTMTTGELRAAFEQAAAGKIEAPEHYQAFSFAYVCGVLNSYRREVNKAMRIAESSSRPAEAPSAPAGGIDWSDTIEYLRAEIRRGRPFIVPVAVYDWLLSRGEISPSLEEKKQAMSRAEARYKAMLQDRIQSKPRASDKQELEALKSYRKGDRIFSILANEAKKIIVEAYLHQSK